MTLRRPKRKDAGAAIAEAVAVLPFLALLAIGGADFGRLCYHDIRTRSAAHAGAQFASYSTVNAKDEVGIRAAVFTDYEGTSDSADLSVGIVRSCICPDESEIDCDSQSCTGQAPARTYVSVTVNRTVNMIFDYPGFPESMDLSREVKLRAG